MKCLLRAFHCDADESDDLFRCMVNTRGCVSGSIERSGRPTAGQVSRRTVLATCRQYKAGRGWESDHRAVSPAH